MPDAPRLYDSRGIITTASGLRYFDLSVGDGDGPIAPGDAVVCSYTMRLGGLNGTKLDSSFDKGEDLRFVVGDKNVVPGVNEMVIGALWRFFVLMGWNVGRRRNCSDLCVY